MTVKVSIFDSQKGKSAKIVNGGALAVLPPEYNRVFTQDLINADEVYNLVPPVPDEYFVGNVIVITGSKAISTVTDAIVSIYATTSADQTLLASNAEVLTLRVARSGNIVIPNMSIRTVNKGAYVNCVTDDAEVNITLFGYYTAEEE